MMVSTPHGMNMFYKIWTDAINKNNTYIPIEVHWSEVPGRDEKWKEETIKNTSEQQFQTEFECEFLGSVNTLIAPSKLKALAHIDPQRSGDIEVFELPKKDHIYTCTVDVSRGTNNDYSAFLIFDTSEMPYKLVAKYRSNEIKPVVFPNIINEICLLALKLLKSAKYLFNLKRLSSNFSSLSIFKSKKLYLLRKEVLG